MVDESRINEGVSLETLFDVTAFQDLLNSFSRMTGIGTAILDIHGNVLVSSGWQRICTDFHRRHPTTAQRCLESDTLLAGELAKGETCKVYKCKNGLVDVAVPLVLEGIHVGNVFTGQFLTEPPDMTFFKLQAETMGFDEAPYLEALREVPVFSNERIEQAVQFLADLTTIIADTALDKQWLARLNRSLEAQVAERTERMGREKHFSDSLIHSLPGVMYLFDQLGHFQRWNRNFEVVSGYSEDQIRAMTPLDFIAAEDKPRVRDAIETVFREGSADVQAGFATIDGKDIPYLFTGYKFVQGGLNYLVGVGLDISDRIIMEKEKENLIAKLQETLSEVKRLSGFLPICASCKKIRDDEGYWNQIEEYIRDRSEVEFSHGLCPDCASRLYGDLNLFSGRND